MNTSSSARMSVLVGERFACVRIKGRANFTASIDFKTLLSDLLTKGYEFFVLDLSECDLMDSTFLGVLAGFGLKLGPKRGESGRGRLELLNPNPRLIELLETLGVMDLFHVSQGTVSIPPDCREQIAQEGTHSQKDVTRACLEAHRTLMDLSPANAARFKDVAQFLAEDLRKQSL